MASRIMQQSVRRLAIAKPSSIATSRAIVPVTSLVHTRPASVSHDQATSTPQDEGMDILVKQRLNRPVAPHLLIYRPQLTWYLSGLNRITGCIVSGGLYLFAASYVAAPLFGWHITSAAMAAGFAKWPVVSQVAAKIGLALPFVFHSFNGVRHLVWDTGRQITNQQVIRSGWAVIGLTAVSTLAVALFI